MTTSPQYTTQEARDALKALEQNILMSIRQYEHQYDITVRSLDLNHSLMMGYPKRTIRVLMIAEL